MKKIRENKRYKNILRKKEKLMKYDYLLGLKDKYSQYVYEIKDFYEVKYKISKNIIDIDFLPDFKSGIRSKRYYKKMASRIKNIDKKLKNVVFPVSLWIDGKVTMDEIMLGF